MNDSKIIDALLLPFERDLVPLPERAFLMRAEPHDALRDEWNARLICEQGFKPAYDRLIQAGFETVERLEGRFGAGLVLLTKHKAENRANLARAWDLLEPGGILVCCGANALGAASHEREAEKVFGLAGSLSKHQARTFWMKRGAGPRPAECAQWLEAASPRPVEGCAMVARAGCFSSEHVDKGSRLLMQCLPEGVAGRVADLGAGWGYLSAEILARFPSVTGVDLFEAESLALEDARTNLGGDPRAAFHWLDVGAGLPKCDPYDWIVSNPPFHEGRKADPAIGQGFINSAWKAIRRRGKFVLVANRSLPYEAELRRRFREVTLLREADGFKVYLASNRHDK
ncbi:Ribosomal RNA small subunit methyltransferase C [Paramagnetospirillum magnetotacticum MS-1]|uniref:Ribosomal RNA small subunit methyltransferase C n=1 Tax=Paramagnetospirillum magnetotacticum MS-1 TaxID=272627 RepID=A0A0C2V1C8_PARME|nr:methyltransferase [Paramagnetospirillum magnetotacticum]KIL98886.1 Ribosomal RNA small subunit methyltransferase C [Paramagnetospirillum magnetotacticum MS-1]